MSDRIGFVQRLDAVEQRLAGHAALDSHSRGALTTADPGTGERWDAGQVWAHLAEFIPYWLEQIEIVMDAYDGEPVPFGRTQSDPTRIAAIERDRAHPISVLWTDTHNDIEQLRRFLVGLDPSAWSARGVHPTMGVMNLDRIVDAFLVAHLEQHADQLDELARNGG